MCVGLGSSSPATPVVCVCVCLYREFAARFYDVSLAGRGADLRASEELAARAPSVNLLDALVRHIHSRGARDANPMNLLCELVYGEGDNDEVSAAGAPAANAEGTCGGVAICFGWAAACCAILTWTLPLQSKAFGRRWRIFMSTVNLDFSSIHFYPVVYYLVALLSCQARLAMRPRRPPVAETSRPCLTRLECSLPVTSRWCRVGASRWRAARRCTAAMAGL